MKLKKKVDGNDTERLYQRSKIKDACYRLLVVVVLLFLWRMTQTWISFTKKSVYYSVGDNNQIKDYLIDFFASWNAYFNAAPEMARYATISTSLILDVLFIFLFIFSVFGKTFRPFVGLFLITILRQFMQWCVVLPKPVGKIWEDPGFPSLVVTYNVSTDYFFSGHTAMAVYMALVLPQFLPIKKVMLMRMLQTSIISVQILFMYVIRGHYTMDIYAAIMTSLAVHAYLDRIPLPAFMERKVS